CFKIFNELGFRAFVGEYAPTADSIEKSYRIVNTEEDVRQLAAGLRHAGGFSMRVLPDQPSAMRACIVGIAFSTSPRDADYVPTGHRSPARSLVEDVAEVPSISLRVALDILRPVLEDPSIKKSGHDLKFDAILLLRNGVTLQGLETDTML